MYRTAQAAASFAGPQGTARLYGIQGKAAGQASNILDAYNKQNTLLQNQEAAANVDIRNREALANSGIYGNGICFDKKYTIDLTAEYPAKTKEISK